jgi:S-DNA-T family DNA segregation ATPase FtsK/SpoIIIE
MAKSRKNGEENGKKSEAVDFAHELWGALFIGIGVLVLVSLVSGFVNNRENILGRFLGTYLASGLVYLFGPLPSFVMPGMILYIGWKRLTGTRMSGGLIVFVVALLIEVCLLFSIQNLPAAASGNFRFFTENFIGNSIIYFLQYLFGAHTFGPYFLCILALTLTLCWGFRMPLSAIFAFFYKVAMANWEKLKPAFSKMRPTFEPRPEAEKAAVIQKPTAPPQEKIHESRKKVEEKPPEKPAAGKEKEAAGKEKEKAEEVILDPVEAEAQRQLEEQLAAFRAKKHEPIKITTMETPEEEIEATPAPEEETVDEEDIPEEFLAGGYEGGNLEDSTVIMKKPKEPSKPYVIPSPAILADPPNIEMLIDRNVILQNSQILEKTLLNFGIEGKVFNVSSGPFVTRYEIELAPGVKVSKVVSLQDDISMAVGGQKIRIEAPIPGKAAIGIELPNPDKQTVFFKHILDADAFRKSKAKLPFIIGKNISGIAYVTDITKMPHLLIAGQTGSGKSVCINSLICSLLMTKTPQELRLIMVDPKKVELAIYEGIPHLMSPVVTESKEAVKALHWATMEMDRRYRLLSKIEGTRNMDSFNARVLAKKYKEGILTEEESKPLPYILIIVDELADLMITASKDVETLIQRIAQLGRAAGVHLVVATQRPSVDIITGPIKANLTSRIAFRTIQSTDSRTILGHVGAEKLLGMGDMLFLRNGAPDIERYHGSFISEEDVEGIVGDINKQQIEIEKIETFGQMVSDSLDAEEVLDESGRDELFEEAARLVVSLGQGSTSLLQRRMKIGYARAGRLMDELERAGMVGPQEGSKMREVLMKPDELERYFQR